MELYIVLACLLLALTAIAGEQRCYYDKDKLAGDYIIPCYGGESSAYACCKQGNKCLEDGACYDQDTGVTYQYGCTDSSYKDPSCPKKCGLNTESSNWVGLVYCDGADHTPDNTWVCHHPDNCGGPSHCPSHTPWSPQIERPRQVACKDLNTTYKALDAGSKLDDTVFLPGDATRISSYLAAHPTATSAVDSSTLVSITYTASQTALPTPTAAASVEPTISAQSSSGLNAIALGICVPLIIGLVGAGVWYFCRRYKRKTNSAGPSLLSSPSKSDGSEPGYSSKAELCGEDRQMFEMQGSPVPSLPHGLSDGSSTVSPYSPGRAPSSTLVSPVGSVFSAVHEKQSPGNNAGPAEMEAHEIYELPG
ncbi:hypothetical protein EJ04DRAFT_226903 [Polyplosphaeria fusca]|uniref:Uncharacterized protein n=1 Tax=Polyplosphaeria fusca TaxID=682080 RepID=A0A9P4QW27_9PLEO|nr:hypothetical protein EJ04DRAFT_226903 [Polyplosphaeria fusca]